MGGWDPSCRRYLKTDEIAFNVPFGRFELMVEHWPRSFLTASAWQAVRNRKAWAEGE